MRACHQVPCFKLVVERLLLRPSSGMERYLVKIAMAMQPALYVPTEKPPPQRLYVITDGEAYYKGVKLVKGDSWGAEDVLLTTSYLKGQHRATAHTYLHVLWVDADTFNTLLKEFREATNLTRLWANVFAAGSAIVADYRRQKVAGLQIQIGRGGGKAQITPEEVTQRLNEGKIAADPLRGDDGVKLLSADGLPLYRFRYNTIELRGFEIVKVKTPAPQASRIARFSSAAGGGPSLPEQEVFQLRETGAARRRSELLQAKVIERFTARHTMGEPEPPEKKKQTSLFSFGASEPDDDRSGTYLPSTERQQGLDRLQMDAVHQRLGRLESDVGQVLQLLRGRLGGGSSPGAKWPLEA